MIIAVGVSFPVGLLFGYTLRKAIAEKKIKSAEDQADFIILEAKKQAETTKKEMLIEAKEEVHAMRIELEKETRERRNELQKIERRNLQKEESLDHKLVQFETREKTITNKEKELDRIESRVKSLHDKQIQELERIALLTVEDARNQLLYDVEKNLTHEKAVMIKNMESEAKLKVDKKSKEILAYAIQKCAADYVAESTVSVVTLPNEEMKGRIIGREGRNIRALETITGVDLIIDDTPEAVILSSFDPVRREIAKTALEKLIVDGRIHPARIEEMVEKSKREMEEQLKEEGENATFDLGIHNIHPELIKLIGRLKYRTSYGQNVLKHSLEVAYLAGTMAAELEVDVRIAKRAGLLHDIGKALDHEIEGTHVEIGMNLLKKYKESKAVIHAMSTHHGDYEPETIEAILVTAADAISAARPGARRETLDNYVKRLEALENITNSYESVEKSYAIQAGREVRIMVVPEKINDDEIVVLAKDVSKRIEDELDYPGQVKVHIIRETRAIEYAK
ncbi:MAG: ribonuclease Y [Bacillota bacterium]|nr:ribonuclease Y [Bacillota bacterium]